MNLDIAQVSVTPELAREWLDQTHINRTRRDDQVEAYARDMRNGKWRPVANPVCFDENGYLIDGQHRLAAIIRSGVTLPLVVQRDLSPADQLVIDSGIKRRPADQLTLNGHKYGVRTASVARTLFAIFNDRPYDGRLRVTNAEIFEILEQHPTILDSVLAVEGIWRQAGVTPLNAGVMHYLGSIKIPNTTLRFFDALKSGAGLAATDPALLLRNRMLSGFDKPSRVQQLWLIGRALVLTKRDVQSYTKLQLPAGSKVTPEQLRELVTELMNFKDERGT